MKRVSSLIPEMFFAFCGLTGLAWDFLLDGRINYIALLVTWLLFVQLIYRNRYIGIVYGVLFTVVAAAALSPVTGLSLLPASDGQEGHPLTFCFYAVSLVMAVLMLRKYIKTHESYNENSITISF